MQKTKQINLNLKVKFVILLKNNYYCKTTINNKVVQLLLLTTPKNNAITYFTAITKSLLKIFFLNRKNKLFPKSKQE